MRRLTWASIEQRNAEFAAAKAQLRLTTGEPAPAGTVLQKESYVDPITQKKITPTYRFFIDNKGKVYAKAEANFAEGAFGKATIIESEEGERWVVKEVISAKEDRDESNNEARVADDIGIAKAAYWNNDAHTLILKYLGTSLNQYLENKKLQYLDKKLTLSDVERLELAIKISREVYKFHTGLASKTKTPYAHLDIKPNNLMIDKDGNVHLIDFGFSQDNPAGNRTTFSATPAYYLPTVTTTRASKEVADIFALLRTLYMPKKFTFYSAKDKRFITCCDEYRKTFNYVLTDDLFKKIPLLCNLENAISRGNLDQLNSFPSALTIHYALIFAKHRLLCQPENIPEAEKAQFALNYERLEKLNLNTTKNVFYVLFHPDEFNTHYALLADYKLNNAQQVAHALNYPQQIQTLLLRNLPLGEASISAVDFESLLNRDIQFSKYWEILKKHGLATEENNTSLKNNLEQFADRLEKLKSCDLAVDSTNLTAILQPEIDTLVKIIITQGLEKARDATKDSVKVNFCNSALTTLETTPSFLIKAARILSHHTNFFHSRASKKETTAFTAAKKYLETARDLLKMDSGKWAGMLSEKPAENSTITPNMTYAFFKKSPPLAASAAPPHARINSAHY